MTTPTASAQAPLSFPADYNPDTLYFSAALREFNDRRRWNLHGVAVAEDLTFYHLLPEEQSQVLARAQELKTQAKARQS